MLPSTLLAFPMHLAFPGDGDASLMHCPRLSQHMDHGTRQKFRNFVCNYPTAKLGPPPCRPRNLQNRFSVYFLKKSGCTEFRFFSPFTFPSEKLTKWQILVHFGVCVCPTVTATTLLGLNRPFELSLSSQIMVLQDTHLKHCLPSRAPQRGKEGRKTNRRL